MQLALLALVLGSGVVLTGCGGRAAQAPGATEAAGPPPAPTSPPTVVPADTPVPTDTPAATATPAPPTPTPRPVATPTPNGPPYPPEAWEHTQALRSYHLALTVSTNRLTYGVNGDYSGSSYHLVITTPLTGAVEVFAVNGHYVAGRNGIYLDSGTTPPPEVSTLEAAQAFARSWIDHPDEAVFKGREVASGAPADHYLLTWKAGRSVRLGALSSTTYDPTSGDVWISPSTEAVLKLVFNMRLGSGTEVSEVTTHMDVSRIDQPVSIKLPAVQK